MILKDFIMRNGLFNDFFSFVISKLNIYCLIWLFFLFGILGKFKSFFEYLKVEKIQLMLFDFFLLSFMRIFEKKE